MSDTQTLIQGLNFNRKSIQIALDMIFVATRYRIPDSKIIFYTPRVMDMRPDIDDDPNTFIDSFVDRSFDRVIGGKTGFLYRRLPLDLIEQDSEIPIVPSSYPYSISDILPQINASLKVQFSERDLLDLTYSGDDEEILLIANPDSTTWIGDLIIHVKPNHVEPIVTQSDLSGFTVFTGT